MSRTDSCKAFRSKPPRRTPPSRACSNRYVIRSSSQRDGLFFQIKCCLVQAPFYSNQVKKQEEAVEKETSKCGFNLILGGAFTPKSLAKVNNSSFG